MPVDAIDAHHHLWKYSPADYPWMLDGMEAIRRDFLIEDLTAVLQESGIAGSVAVQARQTLIETRWLLDLASAHSDNPWSGWLGTADEFEADS